MAWQYIGSIPSLTHWGRVTHICVSKLTIIGSDNGLSPGRRQAIIWTNAGIMLIGSLGTNLSEILIEIFAFSFKKMYLKISSGKWRPSCLCLNVLTLRVTSSGETLRKLDQAMATCHQLCEPLPDPMSTQILWYLITNVTMMQLLN